MVCLSVILLCYRIICLWFCDKIFCNKKGTLFGPDPVWMSICHLSICLSVSLSIFLPGTELPNPCNFLRGQSTRSVCPHYSEGGEGPEMEFMIIMQKWWNLHKNPQSVGFGELLGWAGEHVKILGEWRAWKEQGHHPRPLPTCVPCAALPSDAHLCPSSYLLQ